MNTKPLVGSKLNLTHPLAKDCLGAWLFNEGSGLNLNDATGRNKGFFSSGESVNSAVPGWKTNELGRCIDIFGAYSYIGLGSANNIFQIKNTEIRDFSIVYCFKKTNSTSGRWICGVKGVDINFNQNFIPNNNTFGIELPINNTENINISFVINGNTLNAPYNSFGKNDIWVFQNSINTGMQIWKNGILLAENKNQNPSILSSNHNFVIGDPITDTRQEGNFLYIYNRGLNPVEIKELSISPYQMFKQQTPSIVLEGVYDGIHDVGVGGVRSGSIGKINFYNNNLSIGGINTGGSGISPNITGEIGNGSISISGIAFNTKTSLIKFSGGVGLGGDGDDGVNTNINGGIRITGTSLVNLYDIVDDDLSGGLLLNGISINNLSNNETSTGGLSLGGSIVVEEIISARGGVNVNSGIAIGAGVTSAKGDGGASLGGNISITNYVIERVKGGSVVGDRARAINRVRGAISNIRIGYALAMKNDNIVKINVAKLNQKEKIKFVNREIIRVKDFIRPEELGKWSYIEDSSDNVLPRIVEQRQGEYLPPRKRTPQERERKSAFLTKDNIN